MGLFVDKINHTHL